MTNHPSPKRTDRASRIIHAAASTIYQAFLTAAAIAAWRPPAGMECVVYSFDGREGGEYRMAFRYKGPQQGKGKTTEDADVFTGRFVELVRDERIVEEVDFESDDPAFGGTMTMTTLLKPVPGGTEVTFVASDVPAGISAEDHQQGMLSSLENLARYTE